MNSVEESRNVDESSNQGLTLGDFMFLIASAAVSLFLLRIAASLGLFHHDPKADWRVEFIEYLSVTSGCVLVPLTLVVLIARGFDRRTSRQEVVQGAGFVACVAVCVSAIIPVLYFVVRVGTASELDRSSALTVEYNNFFGRLKFAAGPMIIGAWLALALTRRRWLSPSPMDRLGCLVGISFIAIYLYQEIYYLILRFLP